MKFSVLQILAGRRPLQNHTPTVATLLLGGRRRGRVRRGYSSRDREQASKQRLETAKCDRKEDGSDGAARARDAAGAKEAPKERFRDELKG